MVLAQFSFRWYDAFFIWTTTISIIIVLVNWNNYNNCISSMNLWISSHLASVLLFRCFVLLDSWMIKKLREAETDDERYSVFTIRIPVLWMLSFVLYPFVWTWTILGSIWVSSSFDCLPMQSQKWGLVVWMVVLSSVLVIAPIGAVRHCLERRHAYQVLVNEGAAIHFSIDRFIFEILKNPDFPNNAVPDGEPAGNADIQMGNVNEVSFGSNPHLTPGQRAILQASIESLPRFKMTRLLSSSSSSLSCTICLEDFDMECEVRSLPCAHVFHVNCIDEWLFLNLRCPQCRAEVFPALNLSTGDSASAQASFPFPIRSLSGDPSNRGRLYTRRSQPGTPNPTPSPGMSQHTTPGRSPFPTPRLSPQQTPNLSPRQSSRNQPSASLLSVLLENSAVQEQGGAGGGDGPREGLEMERREEGGEERGEGE